MQTRLYLKIIAAVILFFNCAASTGQGLKNTEWTRVVAENNIDGNLVVNQQQTQNPVKYFFLEDSVLISVKESYSTRAFYSVNNGILSIGNFVKFKIDSLSEQLLIVSDIPKPGIPASRLGIYTFMNTEFIFDYLRQTNQLTVFSDSVIMATELFCPVYNGDLNNIFSDQVDELAYKSYRGSFTIAKNGSVKDIQIEKGKKDDIIKISNRLLYTTGFWTIPPTPKPYDFKIDFELLILNEGNFSGANLYLHP
jgi:hypothetical protein